MDRMKKKEGLQSVSRPVEQVYFLGVGGWFEGCADSYIAGFACRYGLSLLSKTKRIKRRKLGHTEWKNQPMEPFIGGFWMNDCKENFAKQNKKTAYGAF